MKIVEFSGNDSFRKRGKTLENDLEVRTKSLLKIGVRLNVGKSPPRTTERSSAPSVGKAAEIFTLMISKPDMVRNRLRIIVSRVVDLNAT